MSSKKVLSYHVADCSAQSGPVLTGTPAPLHFTIFVYRDFLLQSFDLKNLHGLLVEAPRNQYNSWYLSFTGEFQRVRS